MIVTITPKKLNGEIAAIASKSQAHRLLICAALSGGETTIECPEVSADIEATASCVRALGCRVSYGDGKYVVTPAIEISENALCDCGESGSTLRFIIPVLCALGNGSRLKMHGKLPQRPLSPLWEELEAHGCKLSKPTPDEIVIDGKLEGGKFKIAGNVSSQFISGLMFALPLAGGGTIEIEGELESAGYVDMTVRALGMFGIEMGFDGKTFFVPNKPYTSPAALAVEGDWSNGAFWLCAEALGAAICCTGLNYSSAQRDSRVILELERIKNAEGTVDARDIPDLVPILSIYAAFAKGETRFVNAERLRIKESDRILSVVTMINALGGIAQETADGLTVKGSGGKLLSGGTVSSFNDHRIAMSAAICSVICSGNVIIETAEAVNKSYPAFWDDFEKLGGSIKRED